MTDYEMLRAAELYKNKGSDKKVTEEQAEWFYKGFDAAIKYTAGVVDLSRVVAFQPVNDEPSKEQ